MKQFLIIGASSGIGKALTAKLAGEGHQVYGTYHQTQPDEQANVQYFPLDVTAEIDLGFIPDQLDGIAYCPGSINLMPFKRISPEKFAEDLNLQVIGAVRVLQAAMPALKKAGQSSVVLFSTVAVQSGFNFHAQVAVSKGAVEGLARSLAAELAPAIRVNAIAPSLTDTPLAARLLNSDEKREANAERHPLKRIGTPEDIANAAAFLLSGESSWITGQVLAVDGGMSSVKL